MPRATVHIRACLPAEVFIVEDRRMYVLEMWRTEVFIKFINQFQFWLKSDNT